MSKASSFLKPLPGKSWAFFHRVMEFSAVTPGAQHFSTSESRTNQSLFNIVQCNPNLLLISTGLTAQSLKAVWQHCWGQKIPTAASQQQRALFHFHLSLPFQKDPVMQDPHLLHVTGSRWWCNYLLNNTILTDAVIMLDKKLIPAPKTLRQSHPSASMGNLNKS